jgi:hypothetical protein
MKEGQYIKHYILTDQRSNQKIDTVQLVQIELPRYPRTLFPPSNDFDLADWWMSVLRHSQDYTSEIMERMVSMPDVIKKAFDRLKISTWNLKAQREYQREGADMSLYRDVLEAERVQGQLEGRLEGRLEGLLQERINIAKILLAKGVPDDTILCTGMTKEQLALIKAAKISIASDSESSYSSPAPPLSASG